MKNTSVDPFKDSQPPKQNTAVDAVHDARSKAINIICHNLTLAGEDFLTKDTYKLIRKYCKDYGRWFYSDITNFIFKKCSEDELATFSTNIIDLQSYAYEQVAAFSKKEGASYKEAEASLILIDKFVDHSNLAQRQRALLDTKQENFNNFFDEKAKPYTTELTKELNKELISLVSIFTALSFIIFGGISSLDNIFQGVGSVPIIELVIIGCIWSFGILNLVFSFVYLVSKLTKISICVNESPSATLLQKYPFWVWSNWFLLLILSIFCWLYFIDYSNSGSWLIVFCGKHSFFASLAGFALIAFFFYKIIVLLTKPKSSSEKSSDTADNP